MVGAYYLLHHGKNKWETKARYLLGLDNQNGLCIQSHQDELLLLLAGLISGFGLAKARIIGCAAILLIISCVSAPAAEQPKKISAFGIASPSLRLRHYLQLHTLFWFDPFCHHGLYATPSRSQTVMFHVSYLKKAISSNTQLMHPHQKPLSVHLQFFTYNTKLTDRSGAMIAVPCWSSWNTGMFILSRNFEPYRNIRCFNIFQDLPHQLALTRQ